MYYDKFEELCAEKGVRPGQVSKATGISTSTLSSWKLGRYTPKNDKLQLIAEYFGVPLNYFLEDSYNETLTSFVKKSMQARQESPNISFDFDDLKLLANIKADPNRATLFAWLAAAPEGDVALVLNIVKRLKEGGDVNNED
jgi:transcriptional regulator with XRE-family HTH domain